MKIIFKVSNGSQSHLVDVTNEMPGDGKKKLKNVKIKECDLELYSDTFLYDWFDEFMENQKKPFWIDQSHALTIEVIID